MRAIIQISNKQHERNDLELIDELLFLKICGKMLINYYFDFLYQLGIKELLIAANDIKILEYRLQFIDKLNLDVKFIKSSNSKESYLNNFNQLQDEELLIIENFGFLKNHANTINADFFKQSDNCIFKNHSFKIYYIKNHSNNLNMKLLKRSALLDVKKVDTLEDYFLISNHILKNLSNRYFLPGYSNEDEIILGENVEIEKGCKLIAPVIIMDNVKICKDTKIGPNTVINKNVFIEQGCKVSNSIVYDNIYINSNLNFEDKLVLSDFIVDKNNKKVYNIDTKFVSKNFTDPLKF